MSNNSRRYQAIIFDMGDIFYDATIWRRNMTEHLCSLGVKIDYPVFCSKWEEKLVQVYLGRRKYWDAFKDFLINLGLTRIDIEQTITFSKQRADELGNRILFDNVVETLAELKGVGIKLAVLSDSESRERRIWQHLADLGIEQYFDVVISSIDIGYVKPEKEAFLSAVHGLGMEVNSCIFVGHDADELEGASAAGLLTIGYNYHSDARADVYIQNFYELTSLPILKL